MRSTDRPILLLLAVAACGGREPSPSQPGSAQPAAPGAPDAGADIGVTGVDAGAFASMFASDVEGLFGEGLGVDPAGGLGVWDDSYDDVTSPPRAPAAEYVLVGACDATRGIDAAEATRDFERRREAAA
jgi:hypothetical protein